MRQTSVVLLVICMLCIANAETTAKRSALYAQLKGKKGRHIYPGQTPKRAFTITKEQLIELQNKHIYPGNTPEKATQPTSMVQVVCMAQEIMNAEKEQAQRRGQTPKIFLQGPCEFLDSCCSDLGLCQMCNFDSENPTLGKCLDCHLEENLGHCQCKSFFGEDLVE